MNTPLILPRVLARGVHHGEFYKNGAVPLIAIDAHGNCIGRASARTRGELEAAVALLTRLLDDDAALPSAGDHPDASRASSGPAAIRLVR